MRSIPTARLIVIVSLVLSACAAFDPAVGPQNELVLKPGDRIVATTANGELQIEAPAVQSRHLLWAGRDETVQLGARNERWYGGFGAYGQSGDVLADEEQYDFDSQRAFRFWLKQHTPPKVYSRDGYVVGLGPAPNGNTDIEIFHVCIGGKPVTDLAGGDDALVRLEPAPQTANGLVAWYGCARQAFDPIADAKSDLRESLDIASQVDFWGSGDYDCPVTGAGSAGSAPQFGPRAGTTELVLLPGQRLRAVNRNGPVTIEASDESSRILGWTGDNPRPAGFVAERDPQRTLTVATLAADVRRNGALGAIGCKRLAGNTEYVADFEEAQLNFATVEDFRFWRSWLTHGEFYLDYVYRNDGLLVGYSLGHDSGMSPKINVDLYRICIGGKRPEKLPGANDAALVLTGRPDAKQLQAKYGCAGAVFSPHAAFADYQRLYGDDEGAARAIETYEAEK
jgi:hypothetical protein